MFISRMSLPSLLFLAFVSITFCPTSQALPAYKRQWEKKYGYSTSCSLCHSKGGGSQTNSYGEDFQRFGMTPASFIAIERRDSDKDGSVNIDEIIAKSNPGDFSSNPKAPTDWLSRIEESMLPIEELRKIFPAVDKFSTLDGTLFPAQTKELEKTLNIKLSEADSLPTFYFAIKNQDGQAQRVGVAIFSRSSGDADKLIVGVGVDLTGKIQNIVLIKNKLNDSLNSKDFLSQFKDKSLSSPIELDKDLQAASASTKSESSQVAEAIKKSLLTIRIVFTKNPTTK